MRQAALAAGLALLLIGGCSRPAAGPAAKTPPTMVAATPTHPLAPATTAAPQATPTNEAAMATATAAATEPTSSPATAGPYRRVQSQGLSFEVPSTWKASGDRTIFEDQASKAVIGVNTIPWQPGMEPEAALPNRSVVKGRASVSLPWGSGAEYHLERMAPAAQGGPQGAVLATEVHVLVRLGSKGIVDIYSSVPAGADPTAADRVRQHLLQSVTLLGG